MGCLGSTDARDGIAGGCSWIDFIFICIFIIIFHGFQLEDAFVLDHRTMDTHGYQALLVGCRKVPLLTEQDHRRFQMHHTVCTRAGLSFCLKHLAEFPVSGNGFIPVGARMNAAHFLPGQLVDVCAQSKDKGFQGVVKRWGFKGQSASHGTSLAHRSAGSIGCRKVYIW